MTGLGSGRRYGRIGTTAAAQSGSRKFTLGGSCAAAGATLAHRGSAVRNAAAAAIDRVGPASPYGWSATWCSSASSRCRISSRARRRFRTRSSRTRSPAKNVAELFARGDSIEGQLRKAVPLPGRAQSHLPAVHDRAADVRHRRSAGGTERRRRHRACDTAGPAARLPRQPAHLVCADPAARRLLRLDVQAPAGRHRRRPAGWRPAEARRSRNGARDVRRRRRHRRSRGGDQRGGRLPEGSGEVSPSRRSGAQGRPAGRGAGNRQDAPRAGHGGRGQGPVLQRQRLRVHRDDRRCRRQPRA